MNEEDNDKETKAFIESEIKSNYEEIRIIQEATLQQMVNFTFNQS